MSHSLACLVYFAKWIGPFGDICFIYVLKVSIYLLFRCFYFKKIILHYDYLNKISLK